MRPWLISGSASCRIPDTDGFGFTQDGNQTDRMARVNGRATFITYGQNDGLARSSSDAANALNAAGFPVEAHGLTGIGHTDEWITDATGFVTSTTDPTISDVRARLRNWLDETITNHPGTHSVLGSVVDVDGNPIASVRVQSGETHWDVYGCGWQLRVGGARQRYAHPRDLACRLSVRCRETGDCHQRKRSGDTGIHCHPRTM